MLRSIRRRPSQLAIVAGLTALAAVATVLLMLDRATSAPAADLSGWNGTAAPTNIWQGDDVDNPTLWTDVDNWSEVRTPIASDYVQIPRSTLGSRVVITGVPPATTVRALRVLGNITAAIGQEITGTGTGSSITVTEDANIFGGRFTDIQLFVGGANYFSNNTAGENPLFTRGGITALATAAVLHAPVDLADGAVVRTQSGIDLSPLGGTGQLIVTGGRVSSTTTEAGVTTTLGAASGDSAVTIGTSTLNGPASIDGRVDLTEPTSTLNGTGAKTILPTGSVVVAPGAGKQVTFTGAFTNQGKLDIQTGQLVSTVAPSSFSTTAGSTTTVHLLGNGGVAGTGFTRFVGVNGGTLAGTLAVGVSAGVSAAVGGTYDVGSASAPYSGGFSAVTQTALSDGRYFSGAPVGNAYRLTVKRTVVPNPAPADTDGDGLTDARDCAPTDAKKPAQGRGVFDRDCNGVNDAIQPLWLIGTRKADRLNGRGGADTINGMAGNDIIKGFAGNDKLVGGVGNDSSFGGLGDDTQTGGAGSDKLQGDGGNDKLYGDAGNDKLTGGTGKDILNGGAGNDTIGARDKTVDTITCGAGKDTVVADKKDKVAKNCENVRRA